MNEQDLTQIKRTHQCFAIDDTGKTILLGKDGVRVGLSLTANDGKIGNDFGLSAYGSALLLRILLEQFLLPRVERAKELLEFYEGAGDMLVELEQMFRKS